MPAGVGNARPARRLVLATDRWDAEGRAESEAGLVARRLAGALAQMGEFEVVVPDRSSSGPTSPYRDGAFLVRPVPATPPAPARARLLELALERGGVKQASPSLAGLRSGDAAGLEAELGRRPLDVVALVGWRWPAVGDVVGRLPPTTRVVVVPLLEEGGNAADSLAGLGPAIRRATTAVVQSGYEAGRMADGLRQVGVPAPPVAEIGPPLAVDRLARAVPVEEATAGPYVLVLEAPGAAPQSSLGRHLGLLLPGIRLVRVGADPEGDGPGRAAPSRPDLWRLMAHARALVDLGAPTLFGRDVLEGSLLGVPVVVPAGGVRAFHAAQGGGLWWRDAAELSACVRRIWGDEEAGRRLGAAGRSYAEARYGPGPRFSDALRAVLGAEPATGRLPA